MNNCCSRSGSETNQPGRHICPVNGKLYTEVPIVTIMHHIDKPWEWEHPEQRYYYCDDPDCDVVYFGQDNSIIKKYSIRTQLSSKEKSDSALVCYCFGVNKKQAIENIKAKQFVIDQTRQKKCSCLTSNPSGKCCLKDFPKK